MTYTQIKSEFWAEVRACLLLAVPLAGAQLTQAATAFVDTVMMGLLGSQFLAAGGLGAITFTTLLVIGSSTVSAVSPLAAQAYGAGQLETAGRVARQGLWLSLAIALPVTLLIWNAAPILRMLGQQESNIVLAEIYLQAIAWAFLPGLGFVVLRNFVSALSQPRPVIITMMGGMMFNAIANYVLMFGKLGFPALGLAGIGWASTLTYVGMFAALVIYVLSQRSLRPYRVFHQLHQLDRQMFWDLVQTGLPIGVLAAFETGLFAATTFLMGQLGTIPLAAHQIAQQSAYITFMVPLGISFATTVRVGQLMGQGNPHGARLAGYIGIGIGVVFMSVMAILFWAIPEAIASLYIDIRNPENVPVLDLAKSLLGVAAMFQIADGVQIIAAGALRGLKDTRIPMIIGVIAYWCLGLTSSYLLGLYLGWGGVGLWWGLAIGLATAAVVLTWRFNYLIAPFVKPQ